MQLFYSVLTLAVRAFHGEHDFCNRLVILSATVSWDCFQIPSVCPKSSSISACIHQYSLSHSLSLSLPLRGTAKRTASQREPCVTRFHKQRQLRNIRAAETVRTLLAFFLPKQLRKLKQPCPPRQVTCDAFEVNERARGELTGPCDVW